MSTIIEVIGSLAQSYIVVRFCNRFLSYKYERYGWIAAIMFYALISLDNIYLSQREGYEYLSVAILIAATFVYCILFLKGKIYEKLFVSFVPMLTMLPINLISVLALSVLGKNYGTGDPRPLLLFTCNFAFFIVCEALVKIKKGKEYSLSTRQWLIQLFCFVISVLIAGTLWKISVNSAENKQEFLFIYVLIAILNILLYVLLNMLRRDEQIRAEYNEIQLRLESQKELVLRTEEQHREMMALCHDMKHHLSAAIGLLSKNHPKEAEKYLEAVLDEKLLTFSKTVHTGSSVLDVVLTEKQALCNKKQITLKMLVDTQFGQISETDLSVLLSNLLDNAINGCNGCKEPFIELIVKRAKAYIFITVKNTIPCSVLEANPELITSKPDKKRHGYGIHSIKSIANKYEGTAKFYEEENIFTAEIMLKSER